MSTYKVKKGDSWLRIAKNNNIDMKELLQLNNANEKTTIHPGQEIKLQKEQSKLIPRVVTLAQYETPSDNTRVKKPTLTKKPLNAETTELNWVELTQAYRLANPTIVQAVPELPYLTNYWAFTGNTPAEQFSYQVMQNAKKGMQDAEKAVKSEKVKHTLYKGDPARTKQEGDKKDLIANLLRLLRRLGYYTKTVDGIADDGTRNALATAEKDGYILVDGELIAPNKQNYIKSNSPYALAHRALIGNIYPYDYNPEISLDANNIAGYNEFLTLDLDTPEGRDRAAEIRRMTQKNGKPLFSNRNITDNKELQRQFRERLDLLLLNSGQPQQFNSFNLYTDKKGNTFYQFTNQDINRKYIDSAQASRKAYTTKEDGNIVAYRNDVLDSEGKPIEYIPRDLTNFLFNLYKIQSRKDNFGNYTQVKDSWNLAPFESLPGSSITPVIRIRSYNDYHVPTHTKPEDMIIENSVYDKSSVRLSDKEVPTITTFNEPLSLKFITNGGLHYFKNLLTS